MMIWELQPGMTFEQLGFLPGFFSEEDPRGAREQLDEYYAQGGGWRPFKGFKMRESDGALCYPGDPPIPSLAETKLRDEIIRFYRHAWVVIIQPDASWEVARID